MAVADTKVLLFKDYFWHFQNKIRFWKKIMWQGSIWLPNADFFWIIPLYYYKMQSFPYENHCCECYKKLTLKLWPWYLHLPVFTFTCTLLVCGKITSCCDHCFPQQIRPQNTVQLYILWGYSIVGWLVSIWITNATHYL